MSAQGIRTPLKWNRIDELAEQFGSRAGDVSKRFETRTLDQFRFVVEEVLHRGAFDYRWSVYDDVTDQKVGTGKVMFPSMMDVGYSIEEWRSQYAELYHRHLDKLQDRIGDKVGDSIFTWARNLAVQTLVLQRAANLEWIEMENEPVSGAAIQYMARVNDRCYLQVAVNSIDEWYWYATSQQCGGGQYAMGGPLDNHTDAQGEAVACVKAMQLDIPLTP